MDGKVAKEEQVEEPAQRLSEEWGLGTWMRVAPADARAAGGAGMMGHSPGQNQEFGFRGFPSGSKETFSVSHAAGPRGAGGAGPPVDGRESRTGIQIAIAKQQAAPHFSGT